MYKGFTCSRVARRALPQRGVLQFSSTSLLWCNGICYGLLRTLASSGESNIVERTSSLDMLTREKRVLLKLAPSRDITSRI